MKNRSKRYLALLLSVLMVFSTFSFTSFALEDAAQEESEKSVAAQSVSEEPAAVQDKEEPAKEEPAAEKPAAEEPAAVDTAKDADAPAAEQAVKEQPAAAPAEAQPGQSASEEADNGSSDVPKADETLVYNGKPQTLVTGGSRGSHNWWYSTTSEEGPFTTTKPTGVDVDNYTVWYKYGSNGEVTSLTAKIKKASRTVTVEIEGWSYNEKAKDPVANADPALGGEEKFVYEYKSKAASDDKYSETVPSIPGDYVVRASVKGSKNYEDAFGVAEFTITSGERYPLQAEPTLAKDKDYDGLPLALVSQGGTVKRRNNQNVGDIRYSLTGEDDDWHQSISINGSIVGRAAGEYTVYYKVDIRNQYRDYYDDIPKTVLGVVKISQRELSVEWEAGEPYKYTYDGQAHYPEATLTGDIVGSEDVHLEYSFGESDTAPSDAGDYTVTVALAGEDKDNYILSEDAVTEKDFTIEQREVRLNRVQAKSRPYNGKTTADLDLNSVTLQNVVSGDDVDIDASAGGTGTFADKNVGYNKEVTIDYETANIQLIGADKDNYTINLEESQKTTTASITPLTVKIGWYVDADDEEPSTSELDFIYVYNGDEQGPVAKVENLQSDDEDNEDDCTIVVKGWKKDAGNYTARTNKLEGADKDNYVLVSNEEQDFEITPKVVELGWYQYASDEHRYPGTIPYTYDGENHQPVAKVRNLEEGDSCEVTVVTDPTPAIGAGDYVATATELSNSNYILDETADNTKDFEIEPLAADIVWKELEFTYDGEKHAPVATVDNLIEGDECDVTVSVNPNPAINAGDYTARAEELSNPNYRFHRSGNDRNTTFKIVPLQLTVVWTPTPAEFTYNGTHQAPVATLETPVKEEKPVLVYEYYQLLDGSFSDMTLDETVNAGNYQAIVYLDGEAEVNKNYELALPEGEDFNFQNYTIKKAVVTVKANDKSVNYGDDVPALDATVTGKPAQGDDVNFTLSTDYFKNAKAGTYKVAVKAGENPNYVVTVKDGKIVVAEKNTTLVAKAKAKGKNKGALSWNAITGAASYEVYFTKCNKNGKVNTPKLKATVSGTSYTAKKLAKGTCYKFYVVAKSANGTVISKSQVGHFIAGNVNSKNTNAKSLTVNASSVQLNKGGAFQIVASQKKVKKGKKLLNNNHAALLRYTSSNPAVATVSANGVITATGAGYCKVFVQSVNGLWQEIEVNVQ